jgi:poly [ADP-ribose] polymerase
MTLTKSGKKLFMILEIHAVTEENSVGHRYRVRLQTVDASNQDPMHGGKIEYRFSTSADETLAIYSKLCQTQMESPNNFVKTKVYLGKGVGSTKYQQRQLERQSCTMKPADEVVELIEHIWKEAIGGLEDVLSVPVSKIKIDQVEKAESILLEIRKALTGQEEGATMRSRLQELSKEFYEQLPHLPDHQATIDSKRLIASKQQICQLVLDMVSVSEATGWSRRCLASRRQ